MDPITYIDADGTIVPTWSEQKEGIHIFYKGVWGYAPLIILPAYTKEVLYVVNRSGNAVSHQGAAGLDGSAWKPLQRREKYTTLIRGTREPYQSNEKQRIVVAPEYVNLRLNHEEVAEFAYRRASAAGTTGWWYCAKTSAR